MLIVDSRRGLGAQDVAMLEWVLARNRFAHVLLTKADKLNQRDSTACAAARPRRRVPILSVTAQLFSAHGKRGFDEVRQVVDRWLSAP